MQLSSGMLRVRTGADSLVIGHRASFGHGRGLTRLESEDEVRRRLIDALADPGAIDHVRHFWARLQFATRRITHTSSRMLIERIAHLTVRGPLAAYLLPDPAVKHVLGSAVARVSSGRELEVPEPVRLPTGALAQAAPP